MGAVVKDFTSKKVVDYLNTGAYKSALFVFHHGLGDAVMWQPLFSKMQELYPDISMKQHLHLGQETLFNSVTSDNFDDYDIIFDIAFHMNDHVCDKYTKAEYCCVRELGIDPVSAVVKYNRIITSPLVGVHFFSTCLPESYGCPDAIARKIWDEILASGLIPIDTHMRHVHNNPKNKRFSWNTCSVDCAPANVHNLVGLIQRCAGFCGVASGNFNVATMLLKPEKLLFIKNRSPLLHISRIHSLSVDVNKYDAGVVKEWLDRVKERD